MKRRLGFTLIELAVVLGILDIIAVFAVPQLGTFNETWTLDRFSDSVFNSLRSLGSRVRSTDRKLRATVDLDSNEMTFEQCRWDGGDSWSHPENVPPVTTAEDAIFSAAGKPASTSRSGKKLFG